jgi:hypothetical protein
MATLLLLLPVPMPFGAFLSPFSFVVGVADDVDSVPNGVDGVYNAIR